jgi:hypothetical protein
VVDVFRVFALEVFSLARLSAQPVMMIAVIRMGTPIQSGVLFMAGLCFFETERIAPAPVRPVTTFVSGLTEQAFRLAWNGAALAPSMCCLIHENLPAEAGRASWRLSVQATCRSGLVASNGLFPYR